MAIGAIENIDLIELRHGNQEIHAVVGDAGPLGSAGDERGNKHVAIQIVNVINIIPPTMQIAAVDNQLAIEPLHTIHVIAGQREGDRLNRVTCDVNLVALVGTGVVGRPKGAAIPGQRGQTGFIGED